MDIKKINRKEVEKAKSLIATIDLNMVKKKLMDVKTGNGWTQAYCDDIESLYREFLLMVYLFPKKAIVPTREIDIFWHNHILDTKAYAKDCKKVFSKFIHHYPYSGMLDEDDANRQNDFFEETKKIYFNLFGRIYGGIAMKCKVTQCLQP